jgi:four helix bundle protein
MLKLNHKKLDAWKVSKEMVNEIYLLVNNFPDDEKFGMISQMKRAALSVPLNIAEGASRQTKAERKRFYQISRSSVVEIDTQLELSLGLKFTNTDEIKIVEDLIARVFGMLSKMIIITE